MKKTLVFLVLLAVIAVVSFSGCDNPFSQKDNGTLTYDANGGAGTVPAPQSAELRAKVTVASQNGLVKAGYRFDGWNTKKTGDGDNYLPGATLTLTGDLTLYAKWVYTGNYSPDSNDPRNRPPAPVGTPVTVSYYANLVPGENPLKTVEYSSGGTFKVEGNTFGLEKAGYTFGGWSDIPSVLGNPYRVGATPTITNDTDLYACWLSGDPSIDTAPTGLPVLDAGNHTHAPKNYGYEEDEVDELTIYVHNKGSRETGPLTVEIPSTEELHNMFSLIDTSGAARVRAVEAKTITIPSIPPLNDPNYEPGMYRIKHKAGLPVKNEPHVVKNVITGDGLKAEISVKVEVKPISLDLHVEGPVYANGSALTPIVDGEYTEREAAFTVTVSGFANNEDAGKVGLGSITEIEGLSFQVEDKEPENKTRVFTVKAALSDTSQSATRASFNIALKDNGLPKEPHPHYSDINWEEGVTVTVNIIDGQDPDHAIPVYQANAVHFNAYATADETSYQGVKRHYRQTENITLEELLGEEIEYWDWDYELDEEIYWTETERYSNWTAIGAEGAPFSGSYDGRGYTITNLTITGWVNSFQGMFGQVKTNYWIRNIGLVNAYIKADGNNVGGVVGYNENGTVENCYSTGDISGYQSVGGVVGNNSGKVKYSYSTSDVKGYDNVGGVVGKNSGDDLTVVESCYYTTGNVEGSGNVGGVVGLNEKGKVRYSYAKGATIEAGGGVGGVVGSNGYSKSTVEYCYGEGNFVTSEGQSAGGVVGYNRDLVQYCYASGGTVTGESRSGGVVGKISDGGVSTVQYCYSTSPVSITGYSSTGIFIGGIVGEIMTGAAGTAKILNNVALNSSVTMESSITNFTIRRVIGGRTNFTNYNSADDPITNTPFNYAWSDMPIANNYGNSAINSGSPGTASYHGANISANDGSGNGYLVASWWTTASNWNGSAWNGSNETTTIWYIVNGLPKLNGMPGGLEAQTPVAP